MKKAKTTKAWIAYDRHGKPMIWTFDTRRYRVVSAVTEMIGMTWKYWYGRGCRVHKIEIAHREGVK